MSYAKYLEYEHTSDVRLEYLAGEIFAMAGGTPEHSELAANLIHLLRLALTGKPCAVFTSDLKIRIDAADVSTYPDVAVVCGGQVRSEVDDNAVTNPSVIIAVLSPATEAYDRGEKFEHYRQLPSLRSYVLVAHDRELIEIFERRAEGYLLSEARSSQQIRLDCLDLELSVTDIYRGSNGSSLARRPQREPISRHPSRT